MLSENELKALRIISHAGNGRGLTDLASALVGRSAKSLISGGFVRYDASRGVGYALTAKGLSVLA